MTEKELLTTLLQAFYRDSFSGDLQFLYRENKLLREILPTEAYVELLAWMDKNNVTAGAVE